PPAPGTGDESSMTYATSRDEGSAEFITPFARPFKSQPVLHFASLALRRPVKTRCQPSRPYRSPPNHLRLAAEGGLMTSQERRAAEQASLAAGVPAPGPQAIALLHAAVLKEAIAGRFLEALSICQQALNLDPENADTMHLMGVVSLEAGQVEHAVAWTSRAIGKEPKPAFLTTLGLAFSALG